MCGEAPRATKVFLVAFFFAALALPIQAEAADDAVVKCSKRIAKGLKSYSASVAKAFGSCEVDDLKDEEVYLLCPQEEDVQSDVEKAAGKLWREVNKCRSGPLRAVCPLGARDVGGFVAAASSGVQGPGRVFESILSDAFKTPLNTECPRPAGEVSKDAEKCADRLVRVIEDVSEDAQKCLYKCELANLRSAYREPCLDPDTNLPPAGGKLDDCLERAFEDLEEEVRHRCTADGPDPDALVRELGCPFGQPHIQHVVAVLWDRLYQPMIALNLETFRSDCRSNLDGGEEEFLDPAWVTLSPSGVQSAVYCGQTLGRDFFRGEADERNDTDLDFDSDLDCSASRTGGDGIVIAHSGVNLSGREKWSIEGPSRSSLRDGFGIRIAAGVTDVKIANFRAIQRFAVGIGDTSDSARIEVDDSTIRRNVVAGIQMFAERVSIEDVKVDRNGIGIHLGGDGSSIKESRVLRSENIGVLLEGADADGNGRVFRVSDSDIENNLGPGLVDLSAGARVEDSDFIGNGGAGIRVAGVLAQVRSNSIKLNAGAGVVITGWVNEVSANRSDENSGPGYLVELHALANVLENNGAGSVGGHGNGGHGYEVYGEATVLNTNRAEGNIGSGFYVDTETEFVTNNFAGANSGVGFEIVRSGCSLNTNVAESNEGSEFIIAAGNQDLSGNRANGATFSFGPEGLAGIE